MHEGLLQEDWYAQELERQKVMAAGNPFVQRFAKLGMKEGLFSDMAGALGKVHDIVVDAARPNLIARNIIDTRSTEEALERFPLESESIAYVAAEGGIVRYSGARYTTVDIQTNIIIKDGISWDKEFAEDAKWNVMERQLAALGRSIGKLETDKIIALYAAIAAGSLAGAAEIAGGGAVLTWAKVVEMWDAIEGADFEADTMFMHTKQMSQLFTATEFINSQYMPATGSRLTQGNVGQALTMNLFKTSRCTNGTVHACSKYPAGILLIRRDITTEPWEDVRDGKIGVVATERVGYGILRSTAVSRGTSFKTTF
jgi:hypothetical protein